MCVYNVLIHISSVSVGESPIGALILIMICSLLNSGIFVRPLSYQSLVTYGVVVF